MKTILITGANRGIGLEFTQHYSHADWHVIACCRHPEQATTLHALAQNTSHHIRILPLDLQDAQSLYVLKETLGDTPIDVLINNAGILGKHGRETFGSLYHAPENAHDIFQVNVFGALFLSEYLVNNVANSILKTIVNISSDWGSIALNELGEACLYRASKAALNSITKTMSAVLKNKGIKVIAIHPGWVKTDMGGPSAHITPEESVRGMRKIIDHLTLEDTGMFVKYTGERLPW